MEVCDVPVPEPGPGAVLVKVAGAGLCHSDVMIAQAPTVYGASTFTLGHETAGHVAALGEGVQGLAEGEPVVVHALWGCGSCPTCWNGGERFCPRVKPAGGSGLGLDGGLAEYLLVPAARNVVPLGDVDPVDAGPLADAALTPYHAIRTALPLLRPGRVSVVIGVGGLGHMAVQLLRTLTTTTVVAVEADEGRRRFALELGADLALDPSDDPAGQIRSLAPDGVPLVLDLVGSGDTLTLAASVAGTGGRVVLIGAALGTMPFSFVTLPFECTIGTSYAGEVHELADLVALAQAGRIEVHTTHISLDDVPRYYELLDTEGITTGRAVALPY
jgi:alcohol dehydrogenase, propanol-preferring